MTDPITKMFDDLFTITETKTRVTATLLPPRTKVLKGIVLGVARLKNTLNGNPRYKVFVKSNGRTIEYNTEPNGGWVYGIDFYNLAEKQIEYYSKNKVITILGVEHFYE
tara:strand:- start:6 stop:332 length:327 start_codon:yes stop_codon:yes gene_type:complete